MDTSDAIEANTPAHHYLRAMSVATRIMAERLTLQIPIADVLAELPGLDAQTVATLFAMMNFGPSVRFPNFDDLDDAVVYLRDQPRTL